MRKKADQNTTIQEVRKQVEPVSGTLDAGESNEDRFAFLDAADEEGSALDNFFCNSKNAFPVRLLHTIATSEPGSHYQKVVLVGKSGTGKSHLVRALARHFVATLGQEDVKSGNAREVLTTLAGNTAAYWQKVRVTILDDIQELATDVDCQNTLVTLLEHCPQNCQIVMAFSGNTDGMQRFQPRLGTRLADCLTLGLLEADLDVRMRYMEHAAGTDGLDIDHQTVMYVCQRCRDIPTVRGILQKIRAFSTLHQRRLFHNDIVNILQTGKTNDVPEYRVIINKVASFLGVRAEDILGDKRPQNVVQARQISMYICRTALGLSYPELGRVFGGRDHSTVIYAVNKVQKMMDGNKDMHNLVTRLASNAA